MVIEFFMRIVHTWGRYPASPFRRGRNKFSMGRNYVKNFTGFNSPLKGLKKSANLNNNTSVAKIEEPKLSSNKLSLNSLMETLKSSPIDLQIDTSTLAEAEIASI